MRGIANVLTQSPAPLPALRKRPFRYAEQNGAVATPKRRDVHQHIQSVDRHKCEHCTVDNDALGRTYDQQYADDNDQHNKLSNQTTRGQ